MSWCSMCRCLPSAADWRARVDRVLVVDCDETTQIERVMLRSEWTRSVVEQIISQQAARASAPRVR